MTGVILCVGRLSASRSFWQMGSSVMVFAPSTVCRLTISHSSAVSAPGLVSISAGIWSLQLRGHADRLDVRLFQMIAIGLFHHALQEQPRRKADVRHMRAVLGAAALHGVAQDGYEQFVVFLLLIETLGHDAH